MHYDDAEWHTDSVIDLGLEQSAAATHIGMFLTWAALHNMIATTLSDHNEVIDAARHRLVTPGVIAEKYFVSQICSFMLNDHGNRFAKDAYRAYLNALERFPVVARCETTYHLPDTWDTYDEMAPYFDELYAVWRVERW
ncbi:hypothetical protein AAFP30_14975 [Gordonia sp. CPCC 205515]|uniref:DUF7832 domain-containing protein n=1 Tax=Gordonia sp. CPCC 205515 TaxID=3140791 RepID=UPI003AF3A5E4